MGSRIYAVLADIVVTLHFVYVVVVISGLLLTLIGGKLGWRWVRNFWFRAMHLGMIGVVVYEAWMGILCPLTAWENELRRMAGQSTYDRTFVANFLHNLMFFEAEAWVFTLVYSLFGAAVLLAFYLYPPVVPAWLRKRRKF